MIAKRDNGKAEMVRCGSSTYQGPPEPSAQSKLKGLNQLTVRLLHTVSLEQGVDFYNEVSRFEIELIQRALLHTTGHQRRAASLLNLKVTTLNSKIKHYKISLSAFVNALYPLGENSDLEDRHNA